MGQDMPSGILKYFFRYAVISAAKYGNVRQQLRDSVSTTFYISVPMVDKISNSDVETIHLFNSMLKSICNNSEKNKDRYSSDVALFNEMAIKRMVEALNVLSDFERQVIILHEIEMFNAKQIADMYCCRVKDICQLKHKLIEKITDIYTSLWPLVNENDTQKVSEVLLDLRNCIDQEFIFKAILQIDNSNFCRLNFKN